jgi:hypothetical protein
MTQTPQSPWRGRRAPARASRAARRRRRAPPLSPGRGARSAGRRRRTTARCPRVAAPPYLARRPTPFRAECRRRSVRRHRPAPSSADPAAALGVLKSRGARKASRTPEQNTAGGQEAHGWRPRRASTPRLMRAAGTAGTWARRGGSRRRRLPLIVLVVRDGRRLGPAALVPGQRGLLWVVGLHPHGESDGAPGCGGGRAHVPVRCGAGVGVCDVHKRCGIIISGQLLT